MNFEDYEELVQEYSIKRDMAIDGLTQFVDLGLNARIDLEDQVMKGVSIKLSEYQHELVEAVAKTIGKSKSKVIQELIGSYLDSAYASYLKWLFQKGDLSKENLDLDGLKAHLDKDAKELHKAGFDDFDIFMLFKMELIDMDEALKLHSQKMIAE